MSSRKGIFFFLWDSFSYELLNYDISDLWFFCCVVFRLWRGHGPKERIRWLVSFGLFEPIQKFERCHVNYRDMDDRPTSRSAWIWTQWFCPCHGSFLSIKSYFLFNMVFTQNSHPIQTKLKRPNFVSTPPTRQRGVGV